jgi:ABC-type dipeptide/oligopeptide/nickel transport system permease subunit
MRQQFWHPTLPRARWIRFRERGGMGLVFGAVVLLLVTVTPIIGRLTISSDFYKDPLHSNDVAKNRPPAFLHRGPAAGATDIRPGSSRLDRSRPGEEPGGPGENGYPLASCANEPWPGAFLGTDQRGVNVLWRLVHGTEIIIFWGIPTALCSLILGLLWGLLMGWWNPPLFPGYHHPVRGWRRAAGWLSEKIFEMFDLFPRIILLLFITAIGGISLFKFAIAVGAVITLQIAAGVRQHTVALRRSDRILAAEELGLPPARIVWVHTVWHHLRSFLLSQAAYAMGAFVLWEATTGYLGISEVGHNTWGEIIREGGVVAKIPWMLWSGLACIVITTLGFFKLGDGIDRWKGLS